MPKLVENPEMSIDDHTELKDASLEKEELKLLNRDEAKEAKALRELLISLSAFQIRFIEQYIRTASAGKAARLAGSKSNTPETVGYKLLQDPRIQKAIAIAMKKRIEAVGLDTVEIIQKLREVYDLALEAGKFNDANRACELLQKEIERATKGAGETKATKTLAKMELDGQDVSEELDKVISIVNSIPRK